jgi:uncharacterized membrane protein YhhN
MELYGLAADLVVVLHLAFVLFVVLGGLLALRWPRLAWIHLPVAAYGALIELVGWICPLTPLENWLRQAAGETGYQGGFVEHYLLPVLYPRAFTEGLQLTLGLLVILVNAAIYAAVLSRRRRRPPPGGRSAGGRD